MNYIQMRAFRDELCKIAEVKPELTPEAKPPPTISGTVAKGLAGLVLGTVAGYGLGRGIEAVAKKFDVPAHRYVKPIAMAAGAVLPIAHQLWKGYEQENLTRAVEHQRTKTAKRGVFKKFVNTLSGKNVERAKRVAGTLDKKVEDAVALREGAERQHNKYTAQTVASRMRLRLPHSSSSDADVPLALERDRKMVENQDMLVRATNKYFTARTRGRKVHGLVRDAEKNNARAMVGTGAVAAVGALGGGYHVLGRMADAADRRDAERNKAERSGVK